MTDLDQLMARLEDLDAKDIGLWTDADIDDIIAYQRKIRAQREQGIKPSRKKTTVDPSEKIDLLALGLIKPKPTIIRRA